VILADQSKLGRRAMCRVCGVGRIDRLITNRREGRNLVEEALRKENLRLDHAI